MIQSVVTQAKWGWTQSVTMFYFGLYTLNLVTGRSISRQCLTTRYGSINGKNVNWRQPLTPALF